MIENKTKFIHNDKEYNFTREEAVKEIVVAFKHAQAFKNKKESLITMAFTKTVFENMYKKKNLDLLTSSYGFTLGKDMNENAQYIKDLSDADLIAFLWALILRIERKGVKTKRNMIWRFHEGCEAYFRAGNVKVSKEFLF